MDNNKLDFKGWLDMAKQINEFAIQNRVYHANVIEELHANENAHSRLLRMFLQYDKGRKEFTVFKSFLSIPKIRSVMSSVEMNNPEFFNEKGRIDLLVKDNQYAIIIENKICGAQDQDKQLERYIQYMKGKGINDGNIYVIYLTMSGEKSVSNNSLTEVAKKILGFNEEKNETGRFIPLNYRYDILPWLEGQVLPNCCIKEDLLISGLKQYIDYLKNLTGVETDYNQNRKIMCEIQNKLDLKSLSDWYDAADNVNEFAEKLNQCRNKKIQEVFRVKIENSEAIKELQKEGFNITHGCDYNGFWIDIAHKSWDKYSFECCSENDNEIGIGLIKKEVSDKEITYLKEETNTRFKENGYKNYPWWSIWKEFKTGVNLYSAKYWEKEVNIDEILEEFKNIRKILEENGENQSNS